MEEQSNFNHPERQKGNRTLYIGNLASSVTLENLHQIFSESGKITNSKLAGNHQSPVRFGFIEFEHDESCDLAIEKFNGTVLDNYALKITRAKSRIISRRDGPKPSKKDGRRNRRSPGPSASNRTIHVGNIDPNLDEDFIVGYFEQFGFISNFKFVSNKPKPSFAFFEYSSPQSAQIPLHAGSLRIGEQIARISRSKSVIMSSENRAYPEKRAHTIFCGGLPIDCTKENVIGFFSSCGGVKQVFLKATNQSKAMFALVEFEDEEGLMNALGLINPKWKSNPLRIAVSRSSIREFRRKPPMTPQMPALYQNPYAQVPYGIIPSFFPFSPYGNQPQGMYYTPQPFGMQYPTGVFIGTMPAGSNSFNSPQSTVPLQNRPSPTRIAQSPTQVVPSQMYKRKRQDDQLNRGSIKRRKTPWMEEELKNDLTIDEKLPSQGNF